MANYLPVILSPTVQYWLTGLPANSINSWRDLCTRFINNFQGTFSKPGVEWDLYQIGQRKDESLGEFIQRFMKKKNTIPGVSDAVVMASFRKGVKDPDLLKKQSRRQPKIVKELFDMADRYASQEEAMAAEHDDRPRQNQKKDLAESSKQKDRKRKGDDMVVAAERSRPPRAPRTDDFDKVMESSCPFHPKGKHSAQDCFALKAYVERKSKIS